MQRSPAPAQRRPMMWLGPTEFSSFLQRGPALLDCQPNVHDHIREHIAGAVYVHEESLRLSRGGLPHAWLPERMAEATLRQLGVSGSRPVAIYGSKGASGAGDGMAQMLLAYTLARYGHGNIVILDGGLEAWKRESFPLTRSATKLREGDFSAKCRQGFRITTSMLEEEVRKAQALIVDTRARGPYEGESGFALPGHIPGAVNLPWTELVAADDPCRLREASHLRGLLADLGATVDREVIVYCATGRKAAALFNILRFVLGHAKVRLYEGSFTEWCARPGRKTVSGGSPWG